MLRKYIPRKCSGTLRPHHLRHYRHSPRLLPADLEPQTDHIFAGLLCGRTAFHSSPSNDLFWLDTPLASLRRHQP